MQFLYFAVLLLTTLSTHGQHHFNTENGRARLTLAFKDTAVVSIDNLEIILDVERSLVWIGIHPKSIHLDNKKDQKTLFKRKAFIIECTIQPDSFNTIGGRDHFIFSGIVRGDLTKDNIIGSGFMKPSLQDSIYLISMSFEIAKELLGRRMNRKINGPVVPIDVPQTILTFINLKN